MGEAALTVGIVVLLVTAASQTGLLGGLDFGAVALVGLVGATFCAAALVRSPSRAAVVGLVLSLWPVALLAYFLGTSNG